MNPLTTGIPPGSGTLSRRSGSWPRTKRASGRNPGYRRPRPSWEASVSTPDRGYRRPSRGAGYRRRFCCDGQIPFCAPEGGSRRPEASKESAMKTMNDIRELAEQLRVDLIRCSTSAGSGHPTSSMSAARPDGGAVDRAFSLRLAAAGQSGQRPPDFFEGARLPLLYSMFKAAGVVSDEELMTRYRRFGSVLEGHPTRYCPGSTLPRLARPGAARRRWHRPGRPVS